MKNFIEEFFLFLREEGFDPSSKTEIVADDAVRRFARAGSKKQNSCYRFAIIGDDFAYGWARDWKEGTYATFSHKAKRRLTADERSRLKAEIDAAQAAAKLQREKDRQDARTKAEQIWTRARETSSLTPYEVRKGIQRHHTRVFMNNVLVVPVLNENDDIVAVQMISSDGEKKFNKNAEKNGNWFRFGDTPDRGETIAVCEGYATGASIYEATGITTYCAFDAGNILQVCKKLGKKYNIIICADNDFDTVIGGVKKNIGLLRAQEAAEAVDGRVCVPPYLGVQQPGHSRDFNDMFLQEGAEAVKACIMQLPAVIQKEPEKQIDDTWYDDLSKNKNGLIVQNSLKNLSLFLDNHYQIKNVFAYDQFSLRVIVNQCPPWESNATFLPHDLGNNDLTRFLVWCEDEGLKPSKESAWDAIVSKAHNNSFHPGREFFDKLVWDGNERLCDVLEHIYMCDDDPKYLSIIFKKWMCGAVGRVYNPGCKFDNMLILEGPQYTGKSRSLKNLCTFNGVSYFADNIKDIHNKDTLMTMQGKLIIEFAELAAWRAAETNDLKAFMVREVDMYRPPYERSILNVPRQCVFAGTTNPMGTYFKDVTGNRRFWPVYSKKIDHYKLEEWRDQLWAEAVHCYKNGEQLWLNDEEYALATIAQDERMQADAWIEDIQKLTDERETEFNKFISNGEIYQSLGVDKPRKDDYSLKRIQKVMTLLGWIESRGIVSGAKLRGWRPKTK